MNGPHYINIIDLGPKSCIKIKGPVSLNLFEPLERGTGQNNNSQMEKYYGKQNKMQKKTFIFFADLDAERKTFGLKIQ